MIRSLFTAFRIPELRGKIIWTLAVLAVYRMGMFVPVPGVDQAALVAWAEQVRQSEGGELVEMTAIVSGGTWGRSAILGLGIMPYMIALTIMGLLSEILPALQWLTREGEAGRQRIHRITRWVTFLVAIVLSVWWVHRMFQAGLVKSEWTSGNNLILFWPTAVATLTAGAMFVLWLGESINDRGIGRGPALIVAAGILTPLPHTLWLMARQAYYGHSIDAQFANQMTLPVLLAMWLFMLFVLLVMLRTERRIAVQSAKHVRGRRVHGGSLAYHPVKLVRDTIPLALSLGSLAVLGAVAQWLAGRFPGVSPLRVLDESLQPGAAAWVVALLILVYGFCRYWTNMSYDHREIADNLKINATFIPGCRPGRKTADFLRDVVIRLDFLATPLLAASVAVPIVAFRVAGISMSVLEVMSAAIVVPVMVDCLDYVESHLLMRNYPSLMRREQ